MRLEQGRQPSSPKLGNPQMHKAKSALPAALSRAMLVLLVVLGTILFSTVAAMPAEAHSLGTWCAVKASR